RLGQLLRDHRLVGGRLDRAHVRRDRARRRSAHGEHLDDATGVREPDGRPLLRRAAARRDRDRAAPYDHDAARLAARLWRRGSRLRRLGAVARPPAAIVRPGAFGLGLAHGAPARRLHRRVRRRPAAPAITGHGARGRRSGGSSPPLHRHPQRVGLGGGHDNARKEALASGFDPRPRRHTENVSIRDADVLDGRDAIGLWSRTHSRRRRKMRSYRTTRCLLIAVAATIGIAAPAFADVEVAFERIDGFVSPGTPPELNKVGILEIGPPGADNVLVLNPGTSASAAYFAPLAKTVVEKAHGWQVWAVERRENQLEDHSVLDQAKDGTVTGQELFDYYLGWIT